MQHLLPRHMQIIFDIVRPLSNSVLIARAPLTICVLISVNCARRVEFVSALLPLSMRICRLIVLRRLFLSCAVSSL